MRDSLWFLGLAFLIVPSVTLIAFVILSVLGMTASPLPFLIAIASALICLAAGLKKLEVGRIAISLFVAGFCSTIIFFTALSNHVLDNSWDGLNYHQAYALRMLSGWNIFYSVDKTENKANYFGGRFLEHLPFFKTEGFEAITACWASVAGSIEGGKAQNFAMLLANKFDHPSPMVINQCHTFQFETITHLLSDARSHVLEYPDGQLDDLADALELGLGLDVATAK